MTPPPTTPIQQGPDLGIPLWRVINHERLAAGTQDFPNQALRDYAIHGVQFGLDDTATFPDLEPCVLPNSATRLVDPEAVSTEVAKEVATQRFWPLCKTEDIQRYDRARTWPLGLTKKKTYFGPQKWRGTTNLSKSWQGAPSLNECMPREKLAVQYINPLDCAAAISHFGDKAGFNKFDLTAACRHCGMRVDQLCRHMIEWEGTVHVDRCLCFGGTNGPFQFTAIMCLLAHIIQKEMNRRFGNGNVIVLFLLDDLATVCRTVQMAEAAFPICIAIYEELGFDVNGEKSAKAQTKDEWLGLEFDVPRLLFRLPPDKFERYLEDVARAISSKNSSLKQLEILGGRLNYACYVWPEMRAYLHELWRMKAKLDGFETRTHRITPRFREDMEACKWFFLHGPDRPIRHYTTQDPTIDHPIDPGTDCTAIVGDASGNMGYGFFSTSGHYAHKGWDLSTHFPHDKDVSLLSREDNSTYVETYCMVSAVLTEIQQGFANGKLAYYTDSRNTATNWVMRRSPTRVINDLLRCLMPTLLTNNVELDVRWRHRADTYQKIADDLSRNTDPTTLQGLWAYFPHATTTVTPVSIRPGMAAFHTP